MQTDRYDYSPIIRRRPFQVAEGRASRPDGCAEY